MRFVTIMMLFVFCFVNTAFAGVKKLAVLDFEDTSIASASSMEDNPIAAIALLTNRGQQPQQNDKGKIGKTVASILVTELVKDGTYKIIERSQLEQIMAEQKLGKDGSMSATEAATIGKLLGVSAVVVGSVTEFNVKTEKTGVLGVGSKVKTASVAINARIVDTSTGEILFAAEGKGTEEESNVTVGSMYGSDTSGSSDNLLASATKKASAVVIQTLKDNSARFKDQILEGLVVNVDAKDRLYMIDLGSDNGLAQGQQMYVVKVVKEIKNQSGEVIKRITNVIGELKVTDLEKKVATCTCVNGTCEKIKEGDKVSSNK